MADVKNKTVNIYIDQSSAINALESLQKKADGFNKKIEDAREKQTQLLETIKKSETAASNIDALRKTYADLSKEIENNKKKLAENNEEKKRAEEQLRQLGDRLVDAKDKQRQLSDEIVKAADAGKGTKRLELQYASVTKEIDRTIEKVQAESAALQKAAAGVDHFSSAIEKAKTQQKGLRDEIKLADGAVKTIKNAENEYKSLQVTIDANTKSATKFTEAQKEIQDQIDKGLRPSLNQTKNLVTQLRNELSKMSEDAPGYAEKFEKFKNARNELDRLTQSMNGVEKAQKSWFQEAKVIAFGVLIGNTVQSAAQAIGGYFSGIISGNAKLSDSMADIEKATGLSGKAVEQLNKDIGTIDTRTKAADLREVAVGLGQIGEAADKAKVQAIDQIVVALGDEFDGGAKQITTSLSVLRNNLQDVKTGNYAQDVTHIGNALNVLGAEGLATAPVVTDIANRIAGIAQTFKLSSGQILGVAATFQELGIETERGSTAITKMFQKIGSEPEKFAKVAGIGVKEFKDLVNRDMLGAFTLVAEGAKKAGSNNIVFSKILKELDADGSGAGEVISKLGSKHELLTQKVDLATKALTSNSSITEEFAKKNNNLAAELEKLDKKALALIQSKTLTDLFTNAVSTASKFIDVLRAIPTYIKENQTAVYLLVAGVVLMNATYIKAALTIARDTALKVINAAVTRGTAIASNIAAAAQLTYGLIVDVVTGKMKLAAAASAFYSVILKSSLGPIGAVIAVVGALAIGFTYLFDKQKALTAAQQRANLEMEKSKKVAEAWSDVQQTANSRVAETVTKLQDYAKAAEDTSKSDAERKKAIQGIIDINPTYFKGLDLEAVKTGVLRTKVDEYSQALVAAAQQKAIFDKRVGLEQQKLDLQQKQDPGDITSPDGKVIKLNGRKDPADGVQLETAGTKLLKKQRSEVQRQIDIVDAQLQFLDRKTEELKSKTKNIPGLDGSTTATNPFGDKQTPEEKAAARKEKKEDAERRKLLEALRAFQEELERVGMQADDREIDRIEKKYNNLIGKAQKYGLSYIKLEAEKNRAIAFLLAEEEKARLDFLRKQTVVANDETYKNFINQAVDEGENKKDGLQQQYAKHIITKRQLEEEVRKIDIETLDYEIGIAQSFAGVSKQASADVVTFKKKQNKEQIADAIKTREQLDAIDRREKTAGAAVEVLKSEPGTKGRLDALVNQLKVERDLKLQNEELTLSEIEQINIEFRNKQKEIIKQHYAGLIKDSLEAINGGLDIIAKFGQAATNRENAQLKRDLKANDARKESIKKLEDSKVITAQESRRRIRAIEIDEEKKKEDLEKKQFERNKRMQLAQAISNGALAVTNIWATTPKVDFGVSTYIMLGLSALATIASVAEIASQKFAMGGKVQPEKLKNGKIDVARNIPQQPNGDDVLATVKVGEVVLNEEQQRRLGGPKALRDAGVPGFATGGVVMKPFWKTRPYKSLDYQNITQSMQVVKFATGGVVGKTTDSGPQTTVQTTDPALLDIIKQQQEVNLSLMNTVENLNNRLADGIEANVSLNKLEKAQNQKNRMKKDADFR